MSHRRQAPAARAAPYVLRAVRAGLVLAAAAALLASTVALCITGDPTP
jgi:hypothetical protein